MTSSLKGKSYTSGYRYYFSVLAGICRGPVDQIFLIKSDGKTFWDGGYRAPLYSGDANKDDPYKAPGTDELARVAYTDGIVTDNRTVFVSQPEVYGGDKSQGGIVGLLSFYFGARDQIISAADYVKSAMGALLLSEFRGVLTTFFDGEVCANNPYPKAWTYRVRRVLQGWDGDVWYPDKAVIKLTDPALPVYIRGTADYNGISNVSTVIYSNGESLSGGETTGSNTVVSVESTYTGATVSTYSSSGGTAVTYAVPLEYNDIYAMNPAHIIYECATNRDWGRGLDRNLVDNVSFTDAANTLYSEGFGICLKWSRSEDVDTFVQTVLDHIGGVVYTDKLTGLLCLRLIRGGYNESNLSVFDYDSGLLEVSSVEAPANDVVANEVIVKYRSPVIDADKEARQQNIASMDSLGCVYSTTRDYSGLPTSTLALRVAARDLKILSGGWRKVECKLDRRAYALNPGDVIIINAPDRKLDNLIVRVATVAESKIDDGSITISGAQDVFGLPDTPMTVTQPSEFLEPNRAPVPIQVGAAVEATYRDIYRRYGAGAPELSTENTPRQAIYLAAKPTSSSLNFRVERDYYIISGGRVLPDDYQTVAQSPFCRSAVLSGAIGAFDTVIPVRGDILPGRVALGAALRIQRTGVYFGQGEEFLRLDSISRDAVSGQVYLGVARGCVDTPALPFPKGSRVWVYDETSIIDLTDYQKTDHLLIRMRNHTTLGDDNSPVGFQTSGLAGFVERGRDPYPAADFRVNGYRRDAIPDLTGDLVFTWKHRNRVVLEDALVGESESSTTIEPNTKYSIGLYIITSTGTLRYIAPSALGGLTGTTATLDAATLASYDIADYGAVQAWITTLRWDAFPTLLYLAPYTTKLNFRYGTPPSPVTGTDGFNFHFTYDFDGVLTP